MRISHLTAALLLASATAVPAYAAPEREPNAVEPSLEKIQIAQRDERGRGGFRGGDGRGGERRGGFRGGDGQGSEGRGSFRGNDGFRRGDAAQPQAQSQAPVQQQAAPQFDRGAFMRGNRGGAAVDTNPVQPAPQAQNRGDFGRQDRFDQNRFGRNRFGEGRGGFRGNDVTRGAVPTPNRDFDRNNDGRVDRGFDRNRNGVVDRTFDRNRDGNLDRRFDRNRDSNIDRRFDRNQNGQIDRRYGNNWNRDWRSDRRYNWYGYRNQYRDYYRQPRYYNPYGYGYQRFGVGVYLNSLFFSNRYWINDPYEYRLPAAPYGYRWIRYYDDVLLVDQRNGCVVDAIYNFFW